MDNGYSCTRDRVFRNVCSTEFAEIVDIARCILNQTGRVLRQDGGMGGAL
jgi:hypothetical protein